MSIPQSFIQELLARTDVVDVVGRHVQLKKSGANFSGLCPFHSEKSPSFSVSPSKQFYHCFGCGKSGNAIGFLMEHLGLGFIDAVQDLAQQFGLQVPQENVSTQERIEQLQARTRQVTLSQVLEQAGAAYTQQLKEAPRAIAYLRARGVSGEVAKTFGLGYAPEGWRSLAAVFTNYDNPLLVESGLVIANDTGDTPAGTNAKRYDRFRDRVMFPIRNVKGECIGFGGRVLGDEKPKYLNSPETPVFSKGRELYGLFEARSALREHGYALVTEGYMDVVALAQWGFANAVATLGTACTNEHIHKLFRFTDSIVFSFDGDAAGQRAAQKALEVALPYASDTRAVKFLFLPDEHDPDSFIRTHGAPAFAGYIKQALPLSQFMLQVASQDCELSQAEGRALMASKAYPLWRLLPPGTLQHQLLAQIAEIVQIDSRELLQVWQGGSKNRSLKGHGPMTQGHPPNPAFKKVFTHESKSSLQPATRRVTGRFLPTSREDRVLRQLLSEPTSWERLSAEEHTLLCELPAPHGNLFTWLDSQLHEHGPQPWAALREALRTHAHESYAVGQMTQIHEGIESDWDEVRAILTQLAQLKLAQEKADLAERAATDPAAFERLKELQKRQSI